MLRTERADQQRFKVTDRPLGVGQQLLMNLSERERPVRITAAQGGTETEPGEPIPTAFVPTSAVLLEPVSEGTDACQPDVVRAVVVVQDVDPALEPKISHL